MRLATLTALLCTVGAALCIPLVQRQGPNTIYNDYPKDQTAAINLTAWLVPTSKAQAQKLVGSRTLLRPTGLPDGFELGTDQHLLLFVGGYFSDVRQLNILSIPQLSAQHAYVPWVQVGTNSTAPYNYHLVSYFDQIIPPLVGSLLQGSNSFPGYFDPAHAAYKPIGSSSFSFNVDVGLLNNVLDGPGLTSPAFVSSFQASDSTALSIDFIRGVMDRPVIRTGTANSCNHFIYRFNETFSNPFAVSGNLQTGPALTGDFLVFNGAQGFTGTAEWILATSASPCDSF